MEDSEDYIYKDLTEKIIGCAMRVHRYFGPGFPEIIYQRALAIELQKFGMKAEVQKEMSIYFEEYFMGKRRIDMLIDAVVMVELKAVPYMDTNWNCQSINYLRVFELEIGLLLNFGMKSLQFKRFINNK